MKSTVLMGMGILGLILASAGCHKAAPVAAAKPAAPVPAVSYTHLDVYKRQPTNGTSRRMPVTTISTIIAAIMARCTKID